MPISYAVLLCIPIGFLFFFIARLTSRFVIGRYGPFERRAAMAWGVFGALLIPDIWISHLLRKEFPRCPETVILFLLFAVKGPILGAVFRLFGKSNIDKMEPTETVGS